MAIKAWLGCGMAAAMGLGLLACDDGEFAVDEIDAFEQADVVSRAAIWNDWRLNDWRLNDWRLNGARFNGTPLEGDTLSDNIMLMATHHPTVSWVETAFLTGGQLGVKSYPYGGQSVTLSGAAAVGTHFIYQLTSGGVSARKDVKVTSASPLTPGSDVWVYGLDLYDSNGVSPLCRDANGNPTEALMTTGAWTPSSGARVASSSDTLTFACRTAALAKCIEFGYRPWATANGVALANYHQACTRLVRADYCGNGVAHTSSGVAVHVLDQIGVQNKDPNVSYVVEAEWGPNGATCVNLANTRLPNQTLGCSKPACGAAFASGGLIQSGKI